MNIKIVNFLAIVLMFCLITSCNKTVNDPGIGAAKNDDKKIEALIKQEILKNTFKPTNNGRVFCSYKIIETQKIENESTYYIIAYGQEYYLSNGILRKGTGAIFNVELSLSVKNTNYIINKYKSSLNIEDAETKNFFPENIRSKFEEENKNDFIIKNLETSALNEATTFFNK